jgi:hypothetical protein
MTADNDVDNGLHSTDDVLQEGVLSDIEMASLINHQVAPEQSEEEKLLKQLMEDEQKKVDSVPEVPSQPRRAKRERQCFFQHSSKFIPLAFADMAVRHYNGSDKPVSAIVRWINERLVANAKPPIDVIDFFFLLVERKSQGLIKDRHKGASGRGEVTIEEFNKFYLAWKSGLSSKDCARAIGRDSTTYTYHQLFAPLNRRDKQLKNKASSNSHLRHGDAVLNATSLNRIFGAAERRVIGGRLAFVLFADKLGPDVQKILYQAVPVLRVVMEHANTMGQFINEDDAPHARPKDGMGGDADMSNVSELPAERPKVQESESTTAARLEKEGNTAGHFRVGNMTKRPNFGS